MNHTWIDRNTTGYDNDLLEAHIMAEGWAMLWSCVMETRKALGVRLELTDVMGNNLASLCVFGAWMRRIGQN
ncbi:hypothetical protein LCGC14_0560910 [marine sediment metagenome]|uniref:Uncharacterized protein n=1 Tax=marine sediment metagenome TaxID=412755 RepID=A0A0F9RLW4_9ZZZZ